MNYYAAREITEDGDGTGTFHLTKRNDGDIRPVGYCAGLPDEPESIADSHPNGDQIRRSLRKLWERIEEKEVKDKYHEDGHDTKKEAWRCYKEYCIDMALDFRTLGEQKKKCEVCEEWTQTMSWFGAAYWGPEVPLCDEHANEETVRDLYEISGDKRVMSSY